MVDFESKEWLLQTENFFAVYDSYPVSLGHSLLLCKSPQYVDYFELPLQLLSELNFAVVLLKTKLDATYSPNGYNLGTNVGPSAGQTVPRFHYHVIPRYVGDVENPEGGVRHAVLGKGYYKHVQ